MRTTFDFDNEQESRLFEDLCGSVLEKLKDRAQSTERAFGSFCVLLKSDDFDDKTRTALQWGEYETMTVLIGLNYKIDFTGKEKNSFYASLQCEQLDDEAESEMLTFIADVAGDYWADAMGI